jgi:hypothetical protein
MMHGIRTIIIACWILVACTPASQPLKAADTTPASTTRPSPEQCVAWFRRGIGHYLSRPPLMASEEVYQQRAREFDAALERDGVGALRDLRMIGLARLKDNELTPGTGILGILLYSSGFVPTRLEVLEESADGRLTPVAQVSLEALRGILEKRIGSAMRATFEVTVVPSAYDDDPLPADFEERNRAWPVLRFDARRATGRLMVRLSDDGGTMTDVSVLCMYTPEEFEQVMAEREEHRRQPDGFDRAIDRVLTLPGPVDIVPFTRPAATNPTR